MTRLSQSKHTPPGWFRGFWDAITRTPEHRSHRRPQAAVPCRGPLEGRSPPASHRCWHVGNHAQLLGRGCRPDADRDRGESPQTPALEGLACIVRVGVSPGHAPAYEWHGLDSASSPISTPSPGRHHRAGSTPPQVVTAAACAPICARERSVARGRAGLREPGGDNIMTDMRCCGWLRSRCQAVHNEPYACAI